MSLRKRLSFKRVWNFNTVSSRRAGGQAGRRTGALALSHALTRVVLTECSSGFDSVSVSNEMRLMLDS